MIFPPFFELILQITSIISVLPSYFTSPLEERKGKRIIKGLSLCLYFAYF